MNHQPQSHVLESSGRIAIALLVASVMFLQPVAAEAPEAMEIHCGPAETVVRRDHFFVAADEVVLFQQDTSLVADVVDIQGLLLTAPASSEQDAADLCIETEALLIGPSGVLCTGSGLDGQMDIASGSAHGENGTDGGDLHLVFRSIPLTPETPRLTIQEGGILCTGSGGAGGAAAALPASYLQRLDSGQETLCAKMDPVSGQLPSALCEGALSETAAACQLTEKDCLEEYCDDIAPLSKYAADVPCLEGILDGIDAPCSTSDCDDYICNWLGDCDLPCSGSNCDDYLCQATFVGDLPLSCGKPLPTTPCSTSTCDDYGCSLIGGCDLPCSTSTCDDYLCQATLVGDLPFTCGKPLPTAPCSTSTCDEYLCQTTAVGDLPYTCGKPGPTTPCTGQNCVAYLCTLNVVRDAPGVCKPLPCSTSTCDDYVCQTTLVGDLPYTCGKPGPTTPCSGTSGTNSCVTYLCQAGLNGVPYTCGKPGPTTPCTVTTSGGGVGTTCDDYVCNQSALPNGCSVPCSTSTCDNYLCQTTALGDLPYTCGKPGPTTPCSGTSGSNSCVTHLCEAAINKVPYTCGKPGPTTPCSGASGTNSCVTYLCQAALNGLPYTCGKPGPTVPCSVTTSSGRVETTCDDYICAETPLGTTPYTCGNPGYCTGQNCVDYLCTNGLAGQIPGVCEPLPCQVTTSSGGVGTTCNDYLCQALPDADLPGTCRPFPPSCQEFAELVDLENCEIDCSLPNAPAAAAQANQMQVCQPVEECLGELTSQLGLDAVTATGGSGGSGGSFFISASSLLEMSAMTPVFLGNGGHGGSSSAISQPPATPSAEGGAGGLSGMLSGSIAWELLYAGRVAGGIGGSGGNALAQAASASAIPALDCGPCDDPISQLVCEASSACLTNLVTCVTGSPGEPKSAVCGEGTTQATGKPGGFGVVKGGEGGWAVAVGCNGLAGRPGRPGAGGAPPFFDPEDGEDGQPGQDGGDALATGGPGGNSLIQGGNGGTAHSYGGNGGAGGTGGKGGDGLAVVVSPSDCQNGADGGDGGKGGDGGVGYAAGGAGGSGFVLGSAPGVAVGQNGAGGASVGGEGGKASIYWMESVHGALLTDWCYKEGVKDGRRGIGHPGS